MTSHIPTDMKPYFLTFTLFLLLLATMSYAQDDGDYTYEYDHTYHYEHGPWGYRAEARMLDSLSQLEMLDSLSHPEMEQQWEAFQKKRKEKQKEDKEKKQKKQKRDHRKSGLYPQPPNLTTLTASLDAAPVASLMRLMNTVPDEEERAALVAIYQQMNGSNWRYQDNWLVGSSIEEVGTWFGVTVENGDVVSLDLRSNRLTGKLVTAIGDLSALKYLNLSGNQITEVPTTMGALSSLTNLYLNTNKLSGLPTQIGNLGNLEFLELSYNNLTALPKSIGQLGKLESFYLYFNQLTTLPAEIGDLSSLTNLFLLRNPLTSLPEEIGQLNKLRGLFPKETQLTRLPESITGMASLKFINVENSALESLPDLFKISTLTGVIVSGNKLRQLPDLSNHPNKANLFLQAKNNWLDLNQIAQNLSGTDTSPLKDFLYRPQDEPEAVLPVPGPLLDPFPVKHPQSSYQWQRQVEGSWQDISGAIRPTYTVSSIVEGTLYRVIVTNRWLPDLRQPITIQPVEGGSTPVAAEYNALVALYKALNGDGWQYRNNWLQGTGLDSITTWHGVIVEDGKVVGLDLRQNKLQGVIPEEIAELVDLEYLNLGINKITAIAPEIDELDKLVALYLDQNQLSSVPESIGGLESLEVLNLNANQLTVLPTTIGQLEKLKNLYLYQNQLSTLPAEIGDLSSLENLFLYQNPLTSLPEEIGELSNLKGLFPKETQLTTLPESITGLTKLEWLNVENSQLESLPDLSVLPKLKGVIVNNNFLTEIPDLSSHPNINNLIWGVKGNQIDLNLIAQGLTGPNQSAFRVYAYDPQRSSEEVIEIAEEQTTATLSPYEYVHPQSNFQWQQTPVGSSNWQDIPGATSATYTAQPQIQATLYRIKLTNNWLEGMEQYSQQYQVPSNYTPPTAPTVSNPPDATTAPRVTGTLSPASQSYTAINTVRVYVPRVEITDPASLTMSRAVSDVSVSTEYLDGLGRPVQTVVRGGSNTASQDLVQPMAYDAYGRQIKQYLPYATSGSSGSFRANALADQYDFYTDGPGNVAQSDYPYVERRYESASLSRIVEQAAPGKNWRLGSGHTVRTEYLVNQESEQVRYWQAEPSLSSSRQYATGELTVIVLTDENGHTVREYRDKENLLVLKRVQGPDGTLDTYYVHDDFQQLRYVLPPEASERLKSNYSQASQASFQQQWCFVYTYNGERLMTSKQVPGGGLTQLVYDRWNRLVLTQSALQRSQSQWSFIKYDYLNRPILTGQYSTSESVSSLRSSAEAASVRHEDKSSSGVGYSLGNSFPKVSEADLRTVTYYDDYSFPHASQSDYAYSGSYLSPAVGQVTGSLTRNLEDNTWLKSAIYYDNYYRPVVSVSANHLGGQERSSISYRNAVNSEVLSTVLEHSTSSSSHTIRQNFTYDHQGRMLRVSHQLDGEPEVILSAQQYNAIGELVKKELNQGGSAGGSQTVDYRYNIRGWLEKINELDDAKDYFAQELYYDYGFEEKQYNGNLAGVQWKNADGQKQAYGYLYDEVNRITGADYRTRQGSSWAEQAGSHSVEGISYDKNGNIETLKRYGKVNGLTYILDELSYGYQGNRLASVADDGEQTVGFVDGETQSSSEYGYDASGNMTSDSNKGISSTTYDAVLNLPLEVVTKTGTIRYAYNAAGVKLSERVVPVDGGESKTTHYAGLFQYQDNQLHLIQHQEGRIAFQEDKPNYQFDLKDHLGNIRTTFAREAQTTTAVATMEESNQAAEEALFENLSSSRRTFKVHNTTPGSQSNQVADLNPVQGNIVGPAASRQVYAGDKIKLKVNARYEELGKQQVQGTEGVVASVLSAFGIPASSLETQATYQALSDALAGTVLLGDDGDGVPKAYLNYLLFDANYQLIDQGFRQVSEEAKVTGSSAGATETLSLDINIEESGYLYTYLSNESNWNVSVYFDDFQVEQTSHVVKTEDFTPFGVGFNQPQMMAHRYGYNGKEMQPLTGLLHYGFRQYDPNLGRWHVAEPLADQMPGISVYAYAYNNPTTHVDLLGLAPGYLPGRMNTEAGSILRNSLAGVDNAIATGLAGGPSANAWQGQQQRQNSLTGQLSSFTQSLPGGTQTSLTPTGNGTLYYQIQVGRAYASLTSDNFAGGIILLDQGELSYGNPSLRQASILDGNYGAKDVINYGMGLSGLVLGGTEAHLRNVRAGYAAKGTKTAQRVISKVVDPSITKVARTAKNLGWIGVGLNAGIVGYSWFNGQDVTASQVADLAIGAGLILLGGTVAVFSAPAALVAVGAYGVLDAVGAFDGIKQSLGGNTVIVEGFKGFK